MDEEHYGVGRLQSEDAGSRASAKRGAADLAALDALSKTSIVERRVRAGEEERMLESGLDMEEHDRLQDGVLEHGGRITATYKLLEAAEAQRLSEEATRSMDHLARARHEALMEDARRHSRIAVAIAEQEVRARSFGPDAVIDLGAALRSLFPCCLAPADRDRREKAGLLAARDAEEEPAAAEPPPRAARPAGSGSRAGTGTGTGRSGSRRPRAREAEGVRAAREPQPQPQPLPSWSKAVGEKALPDIREALALVRASDLLALQERYDEMTPDGRLTLREARGVLAGALRTFAAEELGGEPAPATVAAALLAPDDKLVQYLAARLPSRSHHDAQQEACARGFLPPADAGGGAAAMVNEQFLNYGEAVVLFCKLATDASIEIAPARWRR